LKKFTQASAIIGGEVSTRHHGLGLACREIGADLTSPFITSNAFRVIDIGYPTR
jgi:hypothetical protein